MKISNIKITLIMHENHINLEGYSVIIQSSNMSSFLLPKIGDVIKHTHSFHFTTCGYKAG